MRYDVPPAACRILGLALVVAGALAAAPAAHPPATKPGDGAPDVNGARESLANRQVEFSPPAGWIEAVKSRTDAHAAYVSPDHKGEALIEVQPTDAQINDKMAGAIIRKLRETRKAAKQTVVMEPTIEKDPQYLLRIHEKFETGKATADVLRLYRQVGPRVVTVTVSSLAADADAVASILQAGEALAQSATFVKPGAKVPAKKGK